MKVNDLIPLRIRRLGRYGDILRNYLKHELGIWKIKDYFSLLQLFENKHAGEDCFIIGNGPSLNKTDLFKLNSFHCFGMNKIYLIFDRIKLDLSYYVAINPHVIEQSLSKFNTITCPKFLSYKNSVGKVSYSSTLLPIYTKGEIDFSTRLVRPISEGATVTHTALQIAYAMGFQNVFLIGIDHSFSAKGNPHEVQTLHGSDNNHFDPRYFSGNTWQIPDLEASEASYKLDRKMYEKSGRHVYDATIGGKLTVFPKISFTEAIARCKRKSST